MKLQILESDRYAPRSTSGQARTVTQEKRAETIAAQIEEQIFSNDLPVGTRLGSEKDIHVQTCVSRWTFREALSLLEQSGTIEIRRGVHGGIFVAAQMLEIAENRIASYLEFVQPDPLELSQIMCANLEAILDLCHARMTAEHRASLANLLTGTGNVSVPKWLERIRKAWLLLSSSCGNPALAMFKGAMEKFWMHATWYSTLEDEDYGEMFPPIIEWEREGLTAFLDGDMLRAKDLVTKVILRNRTFLESSFVGGRLPSREGALERAYAVHTGSRPRKKSEVLVRDLSILIGASGWQEGMLIGNERELMERYGVGRSIVREAIRSLERLGAISIGRGGASGIRVIRPDPAQVIAASRSYLDRAGLTSPQRAEALDMLHNVRDNLPHPMASGSSGSNSIMHLFLSILDGEN